jgi:hypothetical protein
MIRLELFLLLQVAQTDPDDSTIRGRLLDALTGAPVAGATCELWNEDFEEVARFAESTTTRADGSYELRPRTRDEVKVRLSAPGYRSTVTSLDGGVELLYPNDEPLVVRVLDLDGRPIAGARIRSHQTCRHAPPAVEGVSGPDGRVVLDGAPIRTSTDYEVRASGYGALVPLYFEDLGEEQVVYLPRRAPVRLRLLDESGQPLAHRRFRQQGPGPTAFVTDAEGRAVLDSLYESREIGLEDSTDTIHLHGWPPLAGELVLRVGERSVRPDESQWPLLRVVNCPLHSTLHVQSGDDSLTRELDNASYLTLETHVRPGNEVVVLSQGDEVRRVRLAPWTGERELDFAEAEVVMPRAVPREPVRLSFRLCSPEGEPLAAEGQWLRSYVDRPPEDEDPSPDGVAFSVPRGARYLFRFSAEGHVSLARIGRAGEPEREPELVVLPRKE